MAAIIPFLKNEAFDQNDITAMSMALEEVCHSLKIVTDTEAREHVAVRIVERRESVGAFASVEDLRRVKGIGPAKLQRLRQLVTIVQ